MSRINLEVLRARWGWAPIRGCPGRFLLRDGAIDLRPEDLVGPDCELKEFRVEGARDAVIAGRFEGGGIISYRKADNTYLHTLNTEEGLERKLAQLGISL